MRFGPSAVIAFVFVATGCTAIAPPAPEWRSLTLVAGPFDLDERSWEPLDPRVRVGLTLSMRQNHWPCGFELSAQYAHAASHDESVARSADFYDMRAGAAGLWLSGEHVEFLGGVGLRLASVSAWRPGALLDHEERASSIGPYAHAGVFHRFTRAFAVGVDEQWADGTDFDVLGEDRGSDSLETLVALRWEF